MQRSLHVLAALAALSLIAPAAEQPKATPAPKAEPPPKELGALGEALDVWIAMDAVKPQAVTWSRRPCLVYPTSTVTQRSGDGKKWLDFSKEGAYLTFDSYEKLKPPYTLCIWAQLPMPKNHGLVWQGTTGGGSALYVTKDALCGWSGVTWAEVKYAALPKGLSGWHHLAVSCSEGKTRAFVDGRLAGEVNEIFAENLVSIGSHWVEEHQHWMMCAGLRQQFLFHRALTEAELGAVMAFSDRP